MNKTNLSDKAILSPLRNTLAQEVTCQAPAGATGTTGQVGATGASAYEVAVENGFIGTETEWLNSLIGNVGLPGVSKSTIPYFISQFEGYSYEENNQMVHNLSIPGFGAHEQSIRPNQYGPPQSFTINTVEDVLCAAFSSAYDFTIKSIAFSSWGGGELEAFEFTINAAIFTAPIGSNLFTIEPTSLLTLSPVISSTTPIFSVDGIKDLDIFVPAGTKVAIGAYTDSVEYQLTSYDLSAYLSGSISIETN